MGYPMTYSRVVNRSRLWGGYALLPPDDAVEALRKQVSGDLRRLETDSLDDTQLSYFAEKAGTTKDVVRAVLNEFFSIGY
jgi:hypothetical protein